MTKIVCASRHRFYFSKEMYYFHRLSHQSILPPISILLHQFSHINSPTSILPHQFSHINSPTSSFYALRYGFCFFEVYGARYRLDTKSPGKLMCLSSFILMTQICNASILPAGKSIRNGFARFYHLSRSASSRYMEPDTSLI